MPISPEDDTEIRDLLARYCLYLDLEDVEAWVDLFTPDASYHVYGRVFSGHAGLRRMASGAPGGLHLGGPPVIDRIDDNHAATLQNLLFVERGTTVFRSAVYRDELVRTDGGWRIATRRCRFITEDGLTDRPG